MPERIQRKRTKGWTMPENTVYVGRPSKWGNPYRVTPERTRGEAMSAYEIWFAVLMPPEFREAVKRELRGKNLACWCREGARCHADLLLLLANEVAGASPETSSGAAITTNGEAISE